LVERASTGRGLGSRPQAYHFCSANSQIPTLRSFFVAPTKILQLDEVTVRLIFSLHCNAYAFASDFAQTLTVGGRRCRMRSREPIQAQALSRRLGRGLADLLQDDDGIQRYRNVSLSLDTVRLCDQLLVSTLNLLAWTPGKNVDPFRSGNQHFDSNRERFLLAFRPYAYRRRTIKILEAR